MTARPMEFLRLECLKLAVESGRRAADLDQAAVIARAQAFMDYVTEPDDDPAPPREDRARPHGPRRTAGKTAKP